MTQVLNQKNLNKMKLSTTSKTAEFPIDLEFDIRYLNIFNLFFGLKRAVFSKKTSELKPRDMLEEYLKSSIKEAIQECMESSISKLNSAPIVELIDGPELAARLGSKQKPIAISTIHNMRKRGVIKALKVGVGKKTLIRYEWPGIIEQIKEFNRA